MTYPCLSATEFQAQGTSASAVLSIAKFLAKQNYPTEAKQMRSAAFELADMTGIRLRANRQHRPANDNRARRYSKRAA
ncbi:hypothetical protein [Limoniibacter endophyticus]|uniref:Uncharacterized protein n=1 Tax=Limoniibacter endophyticus TaxID=1565040 RepID=A0A8J3DKM2_9HYPH|nr:hypothetical protein [Limoniibacter endophyticus]GHC61286.1 hypothetical protein GCM10010136_01750 [Limoniibacter endophyticus]